MSSILKTLCHLQNRTKMKNVKIEKSGLAKLQKLEAKKIKQKQAVRGNLGLQDLIIC